MAPVQPPSGERGQPQPAEAQRQHERTGFRPEDFGRMRMISSVRQSNTQLVLPGKNIWWNAVNRPVKSITAQRAASRNTALSPAAAQKAGLRPQKRWKAIFPRRYSTASTASTAADTPSSTKSSRKSVRQSAKCA